MVPFAGFELPVQYGGVTAEHHAVRQRAGLFDVSHMGELAVRGPGAVAAVDALVTNHLARAADGQALYSCCCREDGGILDDLILYRRSEADVLVVCNASNREKIAAHFAERLPRALSFVDESDETALLALQGPEALAILEAVGCAPGPPRERFPRFRFGPAEVAGVAVTVARTGYTGEDGVELFVAWNDAPRLWDALLDAGRSRGLVPAGLGARDTLRLEARLSLYGNEIDETTHPLEAGLAWTVKFDKDHFLGKQALLAAKERGLVRTLVGLEVVGRGIARAGYPVQDASGRQVGRCTSGSPSPTLGKNIALAYLPAELAPVGTRVMVDCRGRLAEAVVVPTPFYRRAG